MATPSRPPAAAPGRFPCADGDAVSRGRRRLALLLLGPAALAAAAAAWAFVGGRLGAGVVAAAAAGLCWWTWRMSRDLDPLLIEVRDGLLVLYLRRRRLEVELDEVAARRLTAAEADHLAGLLRRGGVTTAAGAFDSRLLGEVEVYAGDLGRGVLVESRDSRLVVSPAEPDELMARLLQSSLHG